MWDAPSVLEVLWRNSWQSAVVAGVVLVVRAVLGRAITHRWRHALWALVLCRLLLPVLPQSAASLFSLGDRLAHVEPHRPLAEMTTAVVSHRFHSAAVTAEPVVTPSEVAVTMPAREPLWQRPTSLLTGWLAVAFVLTGRLLWVNLRFARAIRHGSQLTEPRLVAVLESCRREMRCGRSVRLIVTDAVGAPAACGVLKPRVLLPAELARTVPDDRLRLVFLHELAHVRGHDMAIDWLWAVVGALHWFNPVLWMIGPLRRNDRELARDEQVLSLTGPTDAEQYGRALLDLAQSACRVPFCPGLVGMFTGRGPLRRRIEAVARYRGRRLAATWAGVAVLVGTASCALTIPPPPPPPEPGATTAPAFIRMSTTAPATTGQADLGEPDRPSPGTLDVQAKLDRKIKRVLFTATPFDQAMDSLRDQSGANIYVDWRTLQRAGISRSTPVTIQAYDLTLRKALQLLFESVETDKNPLGYAADDGVVTISTQRELDKSTVTRRYDIGDLLFVPDDSPTFVSGIEHPPAISRSDARAKQDERIGEIRRYIEQNVAPNSWKDAGGEVGSISTSPLRSMLLITQTPENHRKIRSVLDSLRQSQGVQVSTTVRFVSIDVAADVPASIRQTLAQATASNEGRTLSPDEAKRLVSAVESAKGMSLLAAPHLISFSGQRTSLSLVSSQPYIQSYTTVVRQTGATVQTTYTPVKQDVVTGIHFDLQGTSSPDRRSVFVDLNSNLSRLQAVVAEHWPGALPSAAVYVQTPVVLTSVTRATGAVPDGATLLLRCGGFVPADAHAVAVSDPTTRKGVEESGRAQAYLMVTPTLLWDPHAATDFPKLDVKMP